MIVTDYYKFEKTALLSGTRMDCVASTKSYPEFEDKRKTRGNKQTAKKDANYIGSLTCYYGDVPDRFGSDARRKADKSVSIGGKNLSSVYVPDVTLPYAFGDAQGTEDAILFVFGDNFGVTDGRVNQGVVMEMFICRGQSKNCQALYNLLCDGGLDDEIEALRRKAVTDLVTTLKESTDAVKGGFL